MDKRPLGALAAGTRLRNYELLSVLGQGGFGITYRARDTTLDREVAIKEYLPVSRALREDGATVLPRSTDLAADFFIGRNRFLDEARTLAKLGRTPAIVRVYDFLEANGTAYMVMDLVEGETLDRRLTFGHRFSARKSTTCCNPCWTDWRGCMRSVSCIRTSSRRTSSWIRGAIRH